MSGTPWVGDSVELGQGRLVDRAADSPCQTGDAISMEENRFGDLITQTSNTGLGARSSCNSDGRQVHWLSRRLASFDD